MVDQEDKQQGGQVEHSKDVLGRADVSALTSDIIEPHKNVHKASRVSEEEGMWIPSGCSAQQATSSTHPRQISVTTHTSGPVSPCSCV